MFTPTDLVVVFLPFPHYRGGYYLKSVAYDTRTNDHRNLFPSPLTLAPSLLGRSVRAVMRFHRLKRDFLASSQMGSDTSLCESEKNRPFRKWESPSPHPSISVAIYHTRRIDAKMHKSQVCTLPINSIMGSLQS